MDRLPIRSVSCACVCDRKQIGAEKSDRENIFIAILSPHFDLFIAHASHREAIARLAPPQPNGMVLIDQQIKATSRDYLPRPFVRYSHAVDHTDHATAAAADDDEAGAPRLLPISYNFITRRQLKAINLVTRPTTTLLPLSEPLAEERLCNRTISNHLFFCCACCFICC